MHCCINTGTPHSNTKNLYYILQIPNIDQNNIRCGGRDFVFAYLHLLNKLLERDFQDRRGQGPGKYSPGVWWVWWVGGGRGKQVHLGKAVL